MNAVASPPHRIVTDRLVVRSYDPSDAPLLKEAADSSIDHLRTFMDWAWDLPEPLEAVEMLLERFQTQFETGESFTYGFFTRDETELVGGGGLHCRVGPEALEIGYWIRASRVRQGLVTEGVSGLIRAAFEQCDVALLEIHVDPANLASQGVAEKLGFVRDATLRKRLPPLRPGRERRDEVVFSLLAEEYAGSPAAGVVVEYG